MNLLKNIDNDTVIVTGLCIIAVVYAVMGAGENIVNTIVGGLIGYIGGRYDVSDTAKK